MQYNDFCRQTLQKDAPDLYAISLMAKQASQTHALWAVFAFHHEIRQTRTRVSEPTLGLIRLQWWRDEIEKTYAGQPVAASEVLAALADAIAQYNVPQDMLLAMITPFEDELRAETPPKTVDEVLKILSHVHTPVLKIASFITGTQDQDDIYKAVAQNRGLIDVLQRAQPQSIVAQQAQAFKDAFAHKVGAQGRIIKAFQSYSALTYSRIEKGRVPAHHPNTPLILWTNLLFQ